MRLAPVSFPSPNFDSRKGTEIELIVLHYTGMESAKAALQRLTDPAARVSCHYLIDEDGTLYSLVDEENRAWHAGISFWRGISDVNAASIGIELVNPGHEFGYRPFPEAQIAALQSLAADIVARRGLDRRNIAGHSDVAPDRKNDPGELFPWERLAASGFGLWPFPSDGRGAKMARLARLGPGENGPLVKEMQEKLASIGYGLKVNGDYDAATKVVVAAFQRRWRPSAVTGIADAGTLERITAVAGLSDHSGG